MLYLYSKLFSFPNDHELLGVSIIKKKVIQICSLQVNIFKNIIIVNIYLKLKYLIKENYIYLLISVTSVLHNAFTFSVGITE